MYLYGKPYPQRDGWHYWGRHYPKSATPEIVGPFETEQQARDHAAINGYGRMDRPKAKKE